MGTWEREHAFFFITHQTCICATCLDICGKKTHFLCVCVIVMIKLYIPQLKCLLNANILSWQKVTV